MKKGLILIGLLFPTTFLIADGLAGVLVSQKVEETIIEGNNFDEEKIYSFVWGSTDFFSDSIGSYINISGTVDWRTEETKDKDEENGKFENHQSYHIYNTGLIYTPISNLNLFGGIGYAESKGKYYKQDYSSRYETTYNKFETEKDKGVNFNIGLNTYYKSIGIIAMYDSFPKVFSIGLSYNFEKDEQEEKPKQNYQTTPQPTIGSMLKEVAPYVAGGLMVLANIPSPHFSDEEIEGIKREEKREFIKDKFTIVNDRRDRSFGTKSVTIKCLKDNEEVLIEYNPKKSKPYRKPPSMPLNLIPKEYNTLDEAGKDICNRVFH